MSSRKQEVGGKLLSSRILSTEALQRGQCVLQGVLQPRRGAVPFVWESKPGTPKSTVVPAAAAHAPPPISPPPSYQSSSQAKANKCRRRPSSYFRPSRGGWMSWFNIRRRLPLSPSPSTDGDRWRGPDRRVDDDDRRPRRAILCF